MRVALVNNLYVDQLGYYYISAALKAAGHDVRFFLTDHKLLDELQLFAPRLVGMTAVTGNHIWAANLAGQVRSRLPGCRTILGGPHATYHPKIVENDGLDFVCRGEGEGPIVELCNRLERHDDCGSIPGIATVVDGCFKDNGFAPYNEDLDSIPFPDRSLIDRFPMMKRNLFPYMLSSRGCPFRCTFCYAPTLKELTRDKGKFVRFRSVDNVIAEGQQLARQLKVSGVEFADDIFGMHRGWLREFAARWPVEVGLPFLCQLRADLLDQEMVDLLSVAGCRGVAFGVESGSDRVRNDILQKDVSRDQIVMAASALRSAGIKVTTFNVLGSPTETFADALETLRLNQEIRPDYAWASLMQPYPETRLYEIAIAEGAFQAEDLDRVRQSYFQELEMRIPHRQEIQNLQKVFHLAVKFPRLERLFLWLSRTNRTGMLYLMFLGSHAWYVLFVKKMPPGFALHMLVNAKELWRRHKSSLYRRELPNPADGPSLQQQVESGAIG